MLTPLAAEASTPVGVARGHPCVPLQPVAGGGAGVGDGLCEGDALGLGEGSTNAARSARSPAAWNEPQPVARS